VTHLRSTALSLLLLAIGCGSNTSAQGTNAVASSSEPVAFAVPINVPELERDPREELLAQGVTAVLQSEHLRKLPLDDALSKRAFDVYLERLDGAKLFLLKSHVTLLSAYAERMDDAARSGDLALSRKAVSLLAQRRLRVAKMVAELLSKPFDYDKDEQLETDPDKLTYSESEKQLRDQWRKVVKLQVLERVGRMETLLKAAAKGDKADDDEEADAGADAAKALSEIPKTFEGREKKARSELATSFDSRFKRQAVLNPLEPTERFVNAIAAVYDPHTQYMLPADKANFDIEMSGSLEGIGAALSVKDHFIVVRDIIAGGAAWRHGELEVGDLIIAVAQRGKKPVDVTDMPIDNVVKMIRGKRGTVVTLTLKKSDGRIAVISITRDVVVVEETYARGAVLDSSVPSGGGAVPSGGGGAKGDAVGYIYLPGFYGNTRARPGRTSSRHATGDVQALLATFTRRKLKGVVIDLRGNGGGLLEHARAITGLLIEKGPVVQSRSSGGDVEVLSDKDSMVAFGGEVVVMVDRFSASASEILAGALQDYRRALIVGTGPTHGKGTVQVLLDLNKLRRIDAGPPLGVLKLTVQQYFLVDGDSTQSRGVVPDVVLPDPAAHVESGERYLDHAIPWSELKGLKHGLWKGSWDAKALARKSKKRVAAEKAFATIVARSKMLKTRREQTRVSLSRKAWQAQRDKDDKAFEANDPKLSKGPARLSVEAVNYKPSKAKPRPAKDGKARKRKDRWRTTLERDPWLHEAVQLLHDMQAK
jgi:carboxyl-terminal processing protease